MVSLGEASKIWQNASNGEWANQSLEMEKKQLEAQPYIVEMEQKLNPTLQNALSDRRDPSSVPNAR